MSFFTRMMSIVTLGSSRPIRRLAAYYAVLVVVGLLLFRFVPALDGLLSGERLAQLAKTHRCCRTDWRPARSSRRRRESRLARRIRP